MIRLAIKASLSFAVAVFAISPLHVLAKDGPDTDLELSWQEGRQFYEPAGITKAMLGSFLSWGTGQYLIGFCRAHITNSDFTYYRGWWDQSPLPHTPPGRKLLEIADETYREGLERGLRDEPERDLCQGILDDWFAQFKAAVETAND